MKKVVVLILYIVLGILLYRFLKNILNPENVGKVVTETSNHAQQIVGGDKDEHGCIGSAGYTWCEEKGSCIRLWEEDCSVNR